MWHYTYGKICDTNWGEGETKKNKWNKIKTIKNETERLIW